MIVVVTQIAVDAGAAGQSLMLVTDITLSLTSLNYLGLELLTSQISLSFSNSAFTFEYVLYVQTRYCSIN